MSEHHGALRRSIGREIATGATWMLAFKVTERSLSLVSTIVLARTLLPADFGILAMALSLAAILELVTSFSFDVALIQRPESKREHLDTAWTFNLIFAVLIFVLMLALAKPAAAYYREPRLEAVIYALAAAWLIQGFENVGTINFRREMRFDKEYKFLALKKVLGVVFTVPLALILQSYWALAIGLIASRLFSVALSFAMHPYRPRLSLAGARDLLGFSGWLLTHNLLSVANQRITDFAIGRIAGAQALGLFNISLDISNLPTSEIAAPINRAMLPGYSKMAREKGQLKHIYLDTVGIMALFTVPAGLGIAAIADPLVRVLLGEKWLDAIPLIQTLAIYGTIFSIGNNTGSAVVALGYPRLLPLVSASRLLCLLPVLIYATSRFGITGAAWSMLIVSLVTMPLMFAILLPRLEVGAREFIEHLWRPAAAAALMYYGVTESIGFLRASGVQFALLQLLVGIAVGAVTYVVATAALWCLVGRPVGAESLSYGWIRARLAKRFRLGSS